MMTTHSRPAAEKGEFMLFPGAGGWERRLCAAALGIGITLIAAGCGPGTHGARASGPGGTHTPTEQRPARAAATPTPAATQSPGAVAPATQPDGLLSFAFPPAVRIVFQTPLPASQPQRGVMIGYENYVDSLWYATYTHGQSTVYEQYTSGNVLSYVQSEISDANYGPGYTLRGTITYYDMTVPGVNGDSTATVSSCVDASGLDWVNEKTGQLYGPIFASGDLHYLEQNSAQNELGGWIMDRVVSYLSSGGGAAAACTS